MSRDIMTHEAVLAYIYHMYVQCTSYLLPATYNGRHYVFKNLKMYKLIFVKPQACKLQLQLHVSSWNCMQAH